MDKKLVKELKKKCPHGVQPGNFLPMDPTKNTFDHLYFTSVLAKRGLLGSDAQLLNSPVGLDLVTKYSQPGSSFFSDFAAAMVRMGSIQWATQGEVRINCSQTNSWTNFGNDLNEILSWFLKEQSIILKSQYSPLLVILDFHTFSCYRTQCNEKATPPGGLLRMNERNRITKHVSRPFPAFLQTSWKFWAPGCHSTASSSSAMESRVYDHTLPFTKLERRRDILDFFDEFDDTISCFLKHWLFGLKRVVWQLFTTFVQAFRLLLINGESWW